MTGHILDDSRFFDPARRRSLGWQPVRKHWFRACRSIMRLRVPRPIRRAVLRFALVRNRRSVAIGAPRAAPICVVGPLSVATGVGEGGRLTGRALAALGFEVLGVDLSDMQHGTPPVLPRPPALEAGPGTVILHFNPDNLAANLTLLGRRRLRGKRIIGYWAWELQRIPDRWIPAFEEVDEVWTPSRFVADAVRPFTSKPVRVVPHPAAIARAGRARRADFGMGDAFVALAMFSFRAFSRKNPVAAVQAFRLAFGGAEGPLLILKSLDGDETPAEMRELRVAIGGAPNIRLENRELGDDDRLDLIASSDVLLSLHRSEGFGLVMAEAMLARVPVIATGWSGNLEYMDEASALLVPCRMVPAVDSRGVYGCEGCWAEPDIAVAAEHLSAVAADPARFEAMRETARARTRQLLGLDAFRRAIEAGR